MHQLRTRCVLDLALGCTMTRPAYFFDIESAEQLFSLLKATANTFVLARAKRTQDLLFLLFGLTHLREWIAPGYDYEKDPTTPGEFFFQEIYAFQDFRTIQQLCNHSKHVCHSEKAMGAMRGGPIDDWPEVDSVTDLDKGAPIGYFADGRDVDDLITSVVTT